MVGLRRSMNEVFRVEKSFELLSASLNLHAAPLTALRSTFTTRSFLRVLRSWPRNSNAVSLQISYGTSCMARGR